jgi:hypothetical protein
VELRFFCDPDSGLPHIYGHGVKESEVEEVLRCRGDDMAGTDNSRIKLGQTEAGRYLQIIYSPDEIGDGVFVITAYEPSEKAKRAYRRRRKRR